LGPFGKKSLETRFAASNDYEEFACKSPEGGLNCLFGKSYVIVQEVSRMRQIFLTGGYLLLDLRDKGNRSQIGVWLIFRRECACCVLDVTAEKCA